MDRREEPEQQKKEEEIFAMIGEDSSLECVPLRPAESKTSCQQFPRQKHQEAKPDPDAGDPRDAERRDHVHRELEDPCICPASIRRRGFSPLAQRRGPFSLAFTGLS